MKVRRTGRSATGLQIGIVAAKFNKQITSRLLDACVATLIDHGVRTGDLEIVRVPGAFEIPLVARTMARANRFDAVICLGAVIRGDTPILITFARKSVVGSARPRWRRRCRSFLAC